MERKKAEEIIDILNGKGKADLVVKNAKVVDVYNKEVFESPVAVKDGLIIGFSSSIEAQEEFDAEGKYLIPGLIDAHCHIESSHLTPPGYSDAVVPNGVTTVIADPHEIANVSGLDGIDYMLESSAGLPLSVFIMFPSCVPATPFEHSGATLTSESVGKYMENERIKGLGEMMNYPGVVSGDDEVLKKLEKAWKAGKIIDGHAPDLTGRELDQYTFAGCMTEHECSRPEELREKVQKGMYVMLREGTSCKNVLPLLPGVDERNSGRILFATDDRQPTTILSEGAVDYGVSLAIRNGLDPLYAVSMATLNAAECYGLSDRGAISPGKRADFFLSKTLSEGLDADEVFVSGKLVAKGGKIFEKGGTDASDEKVKGSLNIKNLTLGSFRLPLGTGKAKVIGIIPGGVVTELLEEDVGRDSDGLWQYEEDRDILKLAVIERHKGTGNIGVGLIKGYGLKEGAVATTISHDSHNVIVVGKTDEDMLLAVNALEDAGGGIAIVRNGKVLSVQKLEIGGLMTKRSLDEVAKEISKMTRIAHDELGVSEKIDPFMTLSFMALPVIPRLKLTDSGLFDVAKFEFVPIES